MNRGGLGKEVFNESIDLFDESFVSDGVTGAGESGVYLLDLAVAAEEEGGRPAVEVIGLGDLLGELIGSSAEDHVISDAVTSDEGAQTGWVLELVGLFEGDVYDLEAFGVVLLIEALEERGFVVAVGAP